MSGYFANIEGSNKHRIIGMFFSVFLAILVLFCCLTSYAINSWLHLLAITFFIFSSSMLSVFGYRGSMISFSGLFAVVMSFALEKTNFTNLEIITNVFWGGISYIIVSGISHSVFQRKHIQTLLADCVALIAENLKISEKIRWSPATNTPAQNSKQLKLQSLINEKLELLRSILMSKDISLVSSNKSRKQFLIFSELVNIYEMSIAKNIDTGILEERMAEHFDKTEPFKEIGQLFVITLNTLSEALRFNKKFIANRQIINKLEEAQININNYVKALSPIKAREVALQLRSLYDHEAYQYQKILLVENIFNNILDGDKITNKKAKLFVPVNDYSIKTIFANLNSQSIIFRHSLRITLAVLISFGIGILINHEQKNWIIVTVILILRPSFGLSKSRAYSRIYGTILGGLFTVILVFLTKNALIYGSVATLSVLIGFSYIQKNYKVASAFITISILLMYFLNAHEPFQTIGIRIAFTGLGFIISIFSIYVFWPVWEQNNIAQSISNATKSNANYLLAVSQIYHSKQNIATDYKLERKEAFLSSGNLNAAFQRMTAEPKSKQKNVSNIYALVLLNQTFLSAVASYSAYIQGHSTTAASPEFDLIVSQINNNLQNAAAILLKKPYPDNLKSIDTKTAFMVLEQKYKDLNEQRNQELASGKITMSLEMRNNLQEGKITVEQLKWLQSTSENIKHTAELLEI
jgi:uncharacterized membrane protein YgaE (UPF0421/DUF939 family)